MKTKSILGLIPILFLSLNLNSAVADDQIVWKLGHTLTVPGTLYEEIFTKEIPKRINDATDGLVRVEPLVGVIQTNDVINALRRNRIQMGSLTVAYSAATHPLWAVLNIPGVIDDQSLVDGVAREVVLPEIAKDMEPMGIRPAVVVGWDGGAYFSNKPINKVEDFKGLRWRTHAPMLSEIISAMDGATVGMPFEELMPSLERGLVDAYTTTFPAMYASGLPDVTKYAIMAPNGTSIALGLVSEQALNALPDDIKDKVINELETINKEVGKKLYEEYLSVIEKSKDKGMDIIEFSDEESKKLVEISKTSVWEPWISSTGKRGEDLLNKVLEYSK